MQICNMPIYKVTSTPATGDTSVTTADLAMFLEFDENDPAFNPMPSILVMAYNALEDEYGAFERADGSLTFLGGGQMTFKDGSTIHII
jgi:hypothetical protein